MNPTIWGVNRPRIKKPWALFFGGSLHESYCFGGYRPRVFKSGSYIT